MQKTYWWRTGVFLLALAGLFVGYAVFYPYTFGICMPAEGHCFLASYKKIFAEPLFLLSLSLLIVSPFLFLVRDVVFLKWLRFALIWFAVAAVLIAATPTYTGGWMSFGPTKESVSIWLSMLFVAVSSIKLVWDMRKAKGIQGKSAK
jgi:hypothetical protein